MAISAEQLTTIGDQFLASYYNTFDTNRAALGALYVSFKKLRFLYIIRHADRIYWLLFSDQSPH